VKAALRISKGHETTAFGADLSARNRSDATGASRQHPSHTLPMRHFQRSPDAPPCARKQSRRRSRRTVIALAGIVALATAGCGDGAIAVKTDTGSTRAADSVRLVPIDGGAHYFANKSTNSAWMDNHILLGAWLEQPLTLEDVRNDARMGDNIYWNLAGTAGHDRVDFNVIRHGGMHASAPGKTANSGSETVMYDGTDEADMNFGPGRNRWLNNGTYNQSACVPANSQCGYTATGFYYRGQPASDAQPGYPIDGTAIHQGFGKGVLFWETDQQAAEFLRESDVLSADSYWLTDSDLDLPSQGGCALLPKSSTACQGTGLTTAQRALPANYAYNVTALEKAQKLNGTSKPVAVDVETGCPGTTAVCVTPPQSIAAAWHALIAGARGIIWFQHNFGGPCIDDRTFADGWNPSSGRYNCRQTPGVTIHDLVVALKGFNDEVNSLTNELLSPTADGYVRTDSDVSTTAKVYEGNCYVFAGAGRPATPPPDNQSVSFTLASHYSGPVAVYDENRSVHAVNGVFSDTFADANAVHVYRIPDGSVCAATRTRVRP
jgi:hypothetical protein